MQRRRRSGGEGFGPPQQVSTFHRCGWKSEGWASQGTSAGFSDRFGTHGTTDNPNSLQNLCINSIADRLDLLCLRTHNPDVPDDIDDIDREHVEIDSDMLRFHCVARGEPVFLHTQLTEQLLERLCLRKRMSGDSVMTLFDGETTRLRNVRIPDASTLTVRGLAILKQHKIQNLEIHYLLDVSRLLDQCLSPSTLSSLRSLNVRRCALSAAWNKFDYEITGFRHLTSLTTLNVSVTSFNRISLECATRDLPMLDTLDISNTKVNDISSLEQIKGQLKSLNLHGLTLAVSEEGMASTIHLLTEMSRLQHLDISDERDAQHPLDMIAIIPNRKISATEFLVQAKDKLPHLKSLDLSAKDDLQLCQRSGSGETSYPPEELTEFIEFHPLLRFLGLAFTKACKADVFSSSGLGKATGIYPTSDESAYKRKRMESASMTSVAEGASAESDGKNNGVWWDRPHKLVVAGNADECQILEMLRRYSERPSYVMKALNDLFTLIRSMTTPRIDIIQLVLDCANQCHSVLGIQLAVTACLYDLSKAKTGENLHPRVLREIVGADLNAMEDFKNHRQLQKNVLLTICNDHILQEVNFDRYRCARLVMDCLLTHEDSSVHRMCVAICSILAAKMTTQETSELGSRPEYMRKLLHIVSTFTEVRQLDITLRFTLSALWNLTDESPTTCRVFLEQKGMELFQDVLKTFPDELAIETKALGLLNNIAEVRHLHDKLMDDGFLPILRKLLRSKHIEVSYFAAGIASHLISDGPEAWSVQALPRDELVQELADVVSKWKVPDQEMVAYRSFAPFFPLLDVNQDTAVQLWAAWAIHHVLSKGPERYCPKLVSQGGVEVLMRLIIKLETPELGENCLFASVRSYCQKIMDIAYNSFCITSTQVAEIREKLSLEKDIPESHFSQYIV